MNVLDKVTYEKKVWNIKLFRGSTWIKIYSGLLCIGIASLVIYNHMYDPYFYFDTLDHGSSEYTQYYKINYIQEHNDEFDCYIVGGSTAGVIDPELVRNGSQQHYNTFSLYFLKGNWSHYYDYCEWLIENTSVRSIILHLSTSELDYNSQDIAELEERWSLPAQVKGDKFDIIKEWLNFSFKSVRHDKVNAGSWSENRANGMLDYKHSLEIRFENPDDYVTQYVVNDFSNINEIGHANISMYNIEEALEYAEKIKRLCDSNDVELIVINGPLFTSKRAQYESDAYYWYLYELVQITDVWDFSDINDANLNPYNYINSGHYDYDLASKITQIVFGKIEDDNFGYKLTTDNIDNYLMQRKIKFTKLVNEYQETGTIRWDMYNSDNKEYVEFEE